METINHQYKPLGSVEFFASTKGLDPTHTETLDAYTKELASRRRTIAELAGISLDALHSGSQASSTEVKDI